MEFTYTISDHKLMVTDLQGCYDKRTNTYRLTDPVLLSKNRKLFGCTNMQKFIDQKYCFPQHKIYFLKIFFSGQRGIDRCLHTCREYPEIRREMDKYQKFKKFVIPELQVVN